MQFLYYTRRRLRVRPRPKIIAISFSVQVAWKKLFYVAGRRKPWPRFYRPKHIIFPPAKADSTIWRKPARPKFKSRRPILRFFRPGRHLSGFIPAMPFTGTGFGGAQTKVFYYVNRHRQSGRPRPRTYPFFTQLTPSNFTYRRPWFLRPRIKRARIHIFRFAKYRLPIFVPPVPSNLSWKRPWYLAQLRIRRRLRLNTLRFAKDHYPIFVFVPPPPVTELHYRQMQTHVGIGGAMTHY